MRRLLSAVTLLVGFVGIISVQAQTPPQCVLVASTNQGAIVASFDEDDRVMVPPENTVLDCASDATALTTIERSASPALNTLLPIPGNMQEVAESQPGYAIVNTPFANLRSGAGPTNTRVAVVRGGTRLVVLGQNDIQTWWYVQAEDVRGWIWNDLLILRGDLTDVPIIETEADTTPATLYVGYTGNPIYDMLTEDAEVVCTILGGLEYEILARTTGATYYYIQATCEDGTMATGWLVAEAGILRNPAGVIIPTINGS